MTIDLVQSNNCETNDMANTSLTGVWGTARTPANYAVFLVAVNENLGLRTLTTPTGWGILAPKYNPGGNHQSVIAYGRKLIGGPDDVPVVSASGPGHMGGFLLEFENVDTDLTLPEEFANNGNASTTLSWLGGTTDATTTPDGLAIAFFAGKGASQVISAPTNGFTLEASGVTDLGSATVDNDRMTYHWLSKELTATGAQNVDVTSSLARRYSSLILTLPEAPPPPPVVADRYYRTSTGLWVS